MIKEVSMKIYSTWKEPKSCVHCDGIITTTAERKVDGRMHKHLDCNVRDELKVTSLDELASAVEEWIAS